MVRDWSEQATLAGGILLDSEASRKDFRGETRKEFLETRAQSPNDPRLLITSQLKRDRAVRRSNLLVKSRFHAAEISSAFTGLESEGTVASFGDWVVQGDWWKNVLKRAADTVAAEHSAHPERSGLALTELRASLGTELPAPELFDVVVAELSRRGFVQVGVAIKATAHRPALPPNLQAAGAKLRAALSAKPLEPPSRKELASDALSQQALRFLLQTGEAVELGEEVVLLAESFNRAGEAIKESLRKRGAATVSEIRQLLGTSRRIALPLLERLDRDGITVRQGDVRRLKTRS